MEPRLAVAVCTVFRNTEIGAYGRTIRLDKPLLYHAARTKFVSLGRATDYSKNLNFYDIRRGLGRRLNGAAHCSLAYRSLRLRL